MKNPFAMMAIMAAAMGAAFRENAYRDAGMSLPAGGGRSRMPGKARPAGSKFLMRAFKAKHGHKPASIEQAREWYAAYLSDADAKVRAVEAERRALRKSRRRAGSGNTREFGTTWPLRACVGGEAV